MKALTATAYGDVENLTLAEMPEPNVGPGDVKIQVHAASINPLDWKLLSGYARGTSMELHFPAILGRDASGDVLEVGDDVKSLRAGDRVLGFAFSTFAQRVVAPENVRAPSPWRTRRRVLDEKGRHLPEVALVQSCSQTKEEITDLRAVGLGQWVRTRAIENPARLTLGGLSSRVLVMADL